MADQIPSDAAVLVFNRTQRCLEELIRLSAPIAEMRSLVAGWLLEPSVEFLVIVSTGGPQPHTAALGARDGAHLRASVLPDAANLIAQSSLAGSVCTSLDLALGSQLAVDWARVVEIIERGT